MRNAPAFALALALLVLLSAFFLWRAGGGNDLAEPAALRARLAEDPFDLEALLSLAAREYEAGRALLREELPWPAGAGETEAVAAWRAEAEEWRDFGIAVDDILAAAEASPRAFARLYGARRRSVGRTLLRRAILHYRQAEALGAALDPTAIYHIGNAYVLLGEGAYPFAEKYLLRMVEAGVRSPHAYTFLGNLAYLSGDTAGALEWYRKAVELAPEDPVVAFNLGLTYAQAGRPAEAVPYLAAACEVLANREDLSAEEARLLAQAYFALGVAAFRGEKYDEAIGALEALRELDADNLEAAYWLSLAYSGAGRKDEARELLEEVVRKDPNFRRGEARTRLRLLSRN